MDLKEYSLKTETNGPRGDQRECYGWCRLRWYLEPTIASANHWCFGGEYGPLLGCNLAFAANEAQFGLSEINWGILPRRGAAKETVNLIGFRNAIGHAIMGENVDGQTVAQWGVVNEFVSLADLRTRVPETGTSCSTSIRSR